ncbi:MAG: ABC transporter ATP-binding protein [Thermodesulfovibrionales bacterium]|nr:ABC transporter ATP-binding protein [Thermodesulfovibrionales bacterium]
MEIVRAEALVKEYDSFRAVDGINFEINGMECFGFLGPNGAGKTTVMKMIHCFMPPTEGILTVFGLDVIRYPSEIKSRLGVMPQENNLDPDLSVIENLIVYARYFGIKKKDALKRAERLLDFVGLHDRLNTNVEELSGGMKRRLVLARALLNEPDLLILDEPTTGLDPLSRRQVWQMIKTEQKKGRTLILTTHYMEEAQLLCNRVAIMDSGRIVAMGSPENLMKEYSGTLEDVYLKLTGKRLIEDTGEAVALDESR